MLRRVATLSAPRPGAAVAIFGSSSLLMAPKKAPVTNDTSAPKRKPSLSVSQQALELAERAAAEKIVKENPMASQVAEAVRDSIPKGTDPHRNKVIEIFRKLAETNRTLGELHRARAFSRAIQLLGEHALANPGVPLTSAEQVKHLKGIGPKLYIRIDEIIRTGTLREMNNLFEDPNMNALMSISAVHGVGPKAAIRMHKIHGISTVDEMRQLVSDGKLELNAAQTIGLRYHEDFTRKIPYTECVAHGDYIRSLVKKVHKDLLVTICGSHRRQLPFSGDIDVLISLPEEYIDMSARKQHSNGAKAKPMPPKHEAFLNEIVTTLRNSNYIIDTLAVGDTKFMGVSMLPSSIATDVAASTGEIPCARRIDIRWVLPQSLPTALLYFTGSKVFNTRMREFALSKGYSLSEYGLYKRSDFDDDTANGAEAFRVPVADEKDVFDVIGFPYIPPEQRFA